MRQQRAYIPLSEKLAAALVQLMQWHPEHAARAQFMIGQRADAKKVVALFDFDHVIAHAHGGSNKWWNLTPMLRAEHREKTAKIDIPRIAKTKRIERDPEKWRNLLKPKRRRQRKRSRWPSRRIQSRGKS